MKKNTTFQREVVGVIAPSRPVYNIKDDIESGIKILEKSGFEVKRGSGLEKRFYYSAGTPEEKASDVNVMFSDNEVKAIICATGGSSSNQILELMDFDLIKKNPKIFLGYSDITTLLMAIYKKTGNITLYGPTISELSILSPDAKKMLIKILEGKEKKIDYPKGWRVLRAGRAEGKLIGGLLRNINSLSGTSYFPDFTGAILFWEELNTSPAMLDFHLQALRLSGVFGKIKGMVVGHLANCIDEKYPSDNRKIEDIILERTAGFNFPIIKVDYFGHDIKNFYTLPIGANAILDTRHKKFSALLK